MTTFTGDGFGKVHVLRLARGEYLLEGIEKLIEEKKIKNAVVVSAAGTLDNCMVHMVMTTGLPPVDKFVKWEDKAFEIASIDGVIANGSPHLHMVVSDHEYAYAGHLEYECRVLYLCEVVIAEINGFNFHRIRHPNGIWELINSDNEKEI